MIDEEPLSLSDPKLKDFIIKFSDLKFEKIIGSGAAGEVSLGIYSPLHKKVAIKKFHDGEIIRNNIGFRREISTLCVIKNPFLLQFVGFTTTSPYCIITKYIPGGSLFQALRENKLNGTDLSIIAFGIASGMKYLHGMKIIHRDLKTENILLEKNKLPVICDLGTSRVINGQQPFTGQLGTPNYMAPEFIKNESYDKSIDVYSFGMILWEMLTKEIPFAGKDPAQILYLMMSKKQLEIPKNTPKNLANLIRSCWDTDPSQRPPFTTIVKLFESGDCFFNGTNKQVFDDAIYHYTEIGKRRPSGSKSNSTCFTTPIFSPLNATELNSRRTPKLKKMPPLIPSPHKPLPKKHDADQRKSSKIQSHMALLANAYIGGMSTGTVQQIKMSIDFFENHANDPYLAQLNIWTKLLPVIISIKTSLFPSIQHLLIRLAQNRDILKSIVNVHDLHRFLRPETYDLFLYVISFVPQAITEALAHTLISQTDITVEKSENTKSGKRSSKRGSISTSNSVTSLKLDPLLLDNISPPNSPIRQVSNETQTILRSSIKFDSSFINTEENNEKAIILLCKIMSVLPTTSEITTIILGYFTSHAIDFSKKKGGNLVLKTLFNYNCLDNSILYSFFSSDIEENVIAAYKCSFSSDIMPSFFTLDQILSHMNSENQELRDCSLEFILRFGNGADGKPLFQIIEYLVNTFDKYDSHKAVLLLCRIASDSKQASFLLIPKTAKKWLKIPPNKAPQLLNVFVLVFKNSSLRPCLAKLEDAAIFLSNVIKYGDNQSFLIACKILIHQNFNPQSNNDPNYFNASKDNSFFDESYIKVFKEYDTVQYIIDKMQEIKDSASLKIICEALLQISNSMVSKHFKKAVKICLNLISERNGALKECIDLLYSLVKQSDTHTVFIDENVINVFSKLKSTGDIENLDKMKAIINILKASGILSIP